MTEQEAAFSAPLQFAAWAVGCDDSPGLRVLTREIPATEWL
jgi:hypothetical protein